MRLDNWPADAATLLNRGCLRQYGGVKTVRLLRLDMYVYTRGSTENLIKCTAASQKTKFTPPECALPNRVEPPNVGAVRSPLGVSVIGGKSTLPPSEALVQKRILL